MTTVNQGMSVKEIEQVVAQQVANSIEVVAIYETKTNMAHKSMSHTKRQEDKVAENVSNKRMWDGDRNGSSSQQNKGHKFLKTVSPIVDMIHERVMASKPKTMQDAIEIATELMGKKISTLVERQAENKRKLDNNNQTQQQPYKKQGVAIADTAGPGENKEYAGTLLLCNKCKFHHNGQCTVKCANCKRVGHLTRDCRSPTTTNNQRNLTCYEYGNQGHYKIDCPERKEQTWKQTEGTGARGVVHALGGGKTNQDPNNIEDEIEA
ncbi:reverse transcriptase domain-containing protein [Tanacetum coccineum]